MTRALLGREPGAPSAIGKADGAREAIIRNLDTRMKRSILCGGIPRTGSTPHHPYLDDIDLSLDDGAMASRSPVGPRARTREERIRRPTSTRRISAPRIGAGSGCFPVQLRRQPLPFETGAG